MGTASMFGAECRWGPAREGPVLLPAGCCCTGGASWKSAKGSVCEPWAACWGVECALAKGSEPADSCERCLAWWLYSGWMTKEGSENRSSSAAEPPDTPLECAEAAGARAGGWGGLGGKPGPAGTGD